MAKDSKINIEKKPEKQSQLEKIVKGIRTLGDNPGPNPSYNAASLTLAYHGIQDFSRINTSTSSGLKEYETFTGQPAGEKYKEEIDLERKNIEDGLGMMFDQYASSHMTSITGELDANTASILGYTFCQEVMPTSANEAYQNTAKKVEVAKKIFEAIKKDPKKYMETKISKTPDYMKEIVSQNQELSLQIDSSVAQRKATAQIQKYGATKFLNDTYSSLDALRKEYTTEAEKLAKEREGIAEKIDPNTDARGLAKALEGIQAKEKTLSEKTQNFKALPELTGSIIQYAIQAIETKEAEKKKKEAEDKKN